MTTTVRMYRQGLGDCFLLGFPKTNGGTYRVLIDCGVILGQPNAGPAMEAVAKNIADETACHIDLLIVTHEHWDHLSGFIQAQDEIDKIQFDEIWLAWTENPSDSRAQNLSQTKNAAITALRGSQARLRFFGMAEQADVISGLLDLYGVAGNSTSDALDYVRKRGAGKTRYCDPSDAPTTLDDTGIRAFVLGPPRDDKLLHTLSESANSPEMYGIGAEVIGTTADSVPFDPMQIVPTQVAQAMPFFKTHYFGEGPQPVTIAPAWRRIDVSYLDAASSIALQLDSYTNNTSLVVAFELPTGQVMLFPGDAQIGSWLSWQTLSWSVDGKAITGPDLLKRAAFYKVGHHGSHNATAKRSGLSQMTALQQAMVPVDHTEAVKKNWVRMPLPAIIDALKVQTNGAVVVADSPLPAGSTAASDALYYEVTVG